MIPNARVEIPNFNSKLNKSFIFPSMNSQAQGTITKSRKSHLLQKKKKKKKKKNQQQADEMNNL